FWCGGSSRLQDSVASYPICAHWPSNLLQLQISHILEGNGELAGHLSVNVVGHTDAAGVRQSFKACCDVHAVAQNIIALDEHVAEIYPEAEEHASIFRHVLVALSHRLLDADRALDRRNNRWEL